MSIRRDMFRLPNYEAIVVSNYQEIHYMELLNDSQKQQNIEELKKSETYKDRRITNQQVEMINLT